MEVFPDDKGWSNHHQQWDSWKTRLGIAWTPVTDAEKGEAGMTSGKMTQKMQMSRSSKALQWHHAMWQKQDKQQKMRMESWTVIRWVETVIRSVETACWRIPSMMQRM